MIVQTRDIKTYVLHCNKYPERWVKIEQLCKNIFNKYEKIESDTTEYTHQQNIAYDSLNLIKVAIQNNIYPFLILEDDATLIDIIPEFITIPKTVDLIYYGSNILSGPPILKNKLKIEDFNNEYYRIYNSQSAHAILIPNKQSAIFLQKIYKIALDSNNYHDIILSTISERKIFITPKDGLYFYQNDKKNHSITKFKWYNNLNFLK